MMEKHYNAKLNCFYVQSFPIFVSYTKNICAANTDTAMLRLIVVETVPRQKIFIIQIEVAQVCLTLTSYEVKNA